MDQQLPVSLQSATGLQFEKFYFIVVAIFLIFIAWQYWGMNRVVDIYPSDVEILVGGNSVTSCGLSSLSVGSTVTA